MDHRGAAGTGKSFLGARLAKALAKQCGSVLLITHRDAYLDRLHSSVAAGLLDKPTAQDKDTQQEHKDAQKRDADGHGGAQAWAGVRGAYRRGAGHMCNAVLCVLSPKHVAAAPWRPTRFSSQCVFFAVWLQDTVRLCGFGVAPLKARVLDVSM